MKSLNLPYLSAAPKEGVMLSFDHERSDVHIRVPREGEMPKNFGKKPLGKWIPMTSSDVPSVSLALGEEPISLMDSGLFRIPKEVSLPELQKLDKKIHIGNGSQMAVFGDEIALSIPLKGWFGCPLPRWQIKWGLRAGEKIAPHRRLIQQDGSSWYIEAQKGRMVIASTEERLNDVLEVGTTSWFSSGEEYEDNHFLARINIPTSMYMFVGPLEYVELTLAAQEEYWEIQFVPYTQSKAKPHQLFLTYFSTLQQWKKKEHTTVPKEVGRFLVHASIQRSIGNVFSIATQTEEEFLDLYFNHFWYEDERVFLEDEERNIWVYDPEEGVRLCVDDVTKGCESVK
jgi:hypothetical protein